MERAFGRVAADRIYEATGIQFLPFNTVFQLLALEGGSALDAAETLLLIPDLLGYWLTGERSAEETNASTTQLLDVESGVWADGLISSLGIPGKLFPELRGAGEILGGLLAAVAEETRLSVSTPVVHVASHDTASAVVAVPFEQRTAAFISSGTWSLVGVELDRPVVSDASRAANLTNERGFRGNTRLLKNVMGLWLVQQCRQAWSDGGSGPSYPDLAKLAEQAPSGGPLFDPDSPELMAHGDMPGRVRAACERAGQVPPDDRAVLIRCVFDSLACKYRLVLEEIEQVTGTPIELVHVIGGGARNDFLCRLTANVSRRPVLAGPVEAAALGNVLAQLYAFGEVGSLDEMRRLARASCTVEAYEPDQEHGSWESMYRRFLQIALPARTPQEATR
jgi:rhamnulokinase